MVTLFSLLITNAVTAMSKIQFWKRITTAVMDANTRQSLWLLCQRYNFESESQLIEATSRETSRLWLLCQRYNFESESQRISSSVSNSFAVTAMSKIQFWKRITTRKRKRFCKWRCDCYVKDTILKANHNNSSQISLNSFAVTAMSKIQFWKRITTKCLYCKTGCQLWLLCQRYNFESESQQRIVACKKY